MMGKLFKSSQYDELSVLHTRKVYHITEINRLCLSFQTFSVCQKLNRALGFINLLNSFLLE